MTVRNFTPFMFKTKSVQERSAKGYKVYKTAQDFVTVEAKTAAEAIESSGVANPFRIEKLGITYKSLFSDTELQEEQK